MISRLSRRDLLIATAALPAAAIAAGCGDEDQQADAPEELAGTPPRLRPTPECREPAEPTESQIEGPFFTPDSPRRSSLLEAGVAGESLLLSGVVLSTGCEPVSSALLDFWQADGEGIYDNRGYRLRGHQFADSRGRFELRTVVPGPYTGRTRHIHVKVQPRGGEVLTTQLYFPGEPLNESDALYAPELEVKLAGSETPRSASFVFVLEA